MATLVLGAVGGLIGGPIGAALGAAIGNRVDQRVLGPKGRKGPRLGDLAIQTSNYGAPIPKVFGRMRIAGSVIWATDLQESRRKQSNGKGQPKTTVYSYSASFAVALSAREIVRVGRIWADGKLLRGEAGDFKTATEYRLYHGTEAQTPDPLITAAEGVGQCPAYRGLAYAVFEDFQLGDYGNRIPSLSFEVIADEAPVRIGSIVETLTGGAVADAAPSLLDGFAATGDSIRSAVETLAAAVPLSLVDDGATLSVRESGPTPIALAGNALGASSSDEARPRIAIEQRSALLTPETLSIAYYDAGRDYQPGVQSARRDGGSRRGERIELPASLSADAAKTLAETRLSALWSERVTARVALGWRHAAIRAGDRVKLPGRSEIWRVAAVALSAQIVELDLVRVSSQALPAVADPGRHVAEIDAPHGPTALVLLDLPPLGDSPADAPQVAVAAAGISPGWRRAALLTSMDGGATWQEAGQTAAPAIIGSAATILAPGTTRTLDLVNSVEIELLNAAMALADADIASLLRGDNAAMLGNELIQYGRAEPIDTNRWRLSRLLRGRRGSEWAVGDHALGEPFVLIEADALAFIDGVAAGSSLSVLASGIGDVGPVEASLQIEGRALRPLSSVHGAATPLAGGDTRISWIRRSRAGWRWPDSIETPFGEETELYRLALSPGPAPVRTVETAVSEYVYSEADRAADIASGAASLSISIVQIGALGVSPPLTFTIPLI